MTKRKRASAGMHRHTVAVLGGVADEPCVLLRQALKAQGIATLMLDQGSAPRASTAWQLDGTGCLRGHVDVHRGVHEGVLGSHNLDSIVGLYLRPLDDRKLRMPPQAEAAALAWTHTWCQIADLATFNVANRISAMASNGSKPLQSQCLAAAGFAVPPMLMSNDPQAVLDFEAMHGPLIYKSASGIRSIVHVLDAAARARLPHIRHTPTLFQKRLVGTNVRVHVIGDELFATEVDSDTVDYRYASRQGGSTELRATRLPLDIEGMCRLASEALALPFAGLDLMLADDGRVYCFEANPSPGYSYYQSATGQNIAGALARYLAGR